MRSMKNWVLSAMVVAGGLGLSALPAQAAEFGVYARGPVAHVGFRPEARVGWVGARPVDRYWAPGPRAYVGVGGPVYGGGVAWGRGPGYDRHFDARFDRDRGHERFRR
jgi:hypothetical protein